MQVKLLDLLIERAKSLLVALLNQKEVASKLNHQLDDPVIEAESGAQASTGSAVRVVCLIFCSCERLGCVAAGIVAQPKVQLIN